MDHPSFQSFNPLRVADWRHQRTTELVGHRPRPLPASPKLDDGWISKYRGFLLRHAHASLEDDPVAARSRLFSRSPGLYYAHLLRTTTDQEWRTIIESRLLAGQDDEEIAELCGTIPETIAWYAALYFDVRDRMECRDWIIKTILGPLSARSANRSDTMTPVQRDLLYKLFAYFGGPVVLDIAISGFNRAPAPDRHEDAGRWLDQAFQTAIRRKATMSAHMFEVDRYKVMELLNLHVSLIVNARESGSALAGEVGQGLQAAVDSMPWTTAARAQRAREALGHKEALGHIEPRASEQLLLAAGERPATLTARTRALDVDRIEGRRRDVVQEVAQEAAE